MTAKEEKLSERLRKHAEFLRSWEVFAAFTPDTSPESFERWADEIAALEARLALEAPIVSAAELLDLFALKDECGCCSGDVTNEEREATWLALREAVNRKREASR